MVPSSKPRIFSRRAWAGLAILTAFPAVFFAQQPQADCYATLRAYVQDRSLNARWEGNTVVMKRGGVEYVCRCLSATRPPDCGPRNSSGAGGLDGADLSQFKPGQQMALRATQSLLEGILGSIFSSPSKANSVSAEDALRAQQAMLRKQEEERMQALQSWDIFQEEEKSRLQAEQDEARKSGQALLDKMGATTGQGLEFVTLSGEKLDLGDGAAQRTERKRLASGKYEAPNTAAEQARCAAYFSDKASELSRQGKLEEAQFMNAQAQKAMAGEPTEVPCQAPAAGPKAGPQGPEIDVNALLGQYNAKIRDLLGISQKLAEVRKQKLEAQLDINQTEARILDIRAKSASVAKPEEKQQLDDLLKEALALQGESEARLKIAEENENSYLSDAKQAEDQVKELNTKLQKNKDAI